MVALGFFNILSLEMEIMDISGCIRLPERVRVQIQSYELGGAADISFLLRGSSLAVTPVAGGRWVHSVF